MNLFQSGNFTLHSGAKSDLKIECDALTDADWETIARVISKQVKFALVCGVLRGGTKLALALEQYRTKEGTDTILLVDDVLTTGASMEERRKHLEQLYPYGNIIGVVLFARAEPPAWVHPIFRFIFLNVTI